MKITKEQLKQIIKEELEEGLVDKAAGMFGFERKKTPKSEQLYNLAQKFQNFGYSTGFESPRELKAQDDLVKLMDEAKFAVQQFPEVKEAKEGVYKALRNMYDALRSASSEANEREIAAKE